MSGEVWTLAELRGGEVHSVSTELLAWGRELADTLGVPLASVVIGNSNERENTENSITDLHKKSAELAYYGADKIYSVDLHKITLPGSPVMTDVEVNVLSSLVERFTPSILIAAATTKGRTVMPMLSAALGCGLTADCTELSIDTKTKRLIQTRPAIGGNVMADIKTKGRDPQMCTVRPKSKRPLQADLSRQAEIVELTQSDFDLKSFFESKLKFIKFTPENQVGVPLQEADIIVAGGKGMKGAKNFARLEELARLLGGSVGASRAAVDLGWASYSAQVGLSGKSVTPRFYIAFGISGAVQHLAGISGADTIIAINHDPEAPIFRVADLSIQGDCMEVLEALIKALKKQ